MSYSRRFRHPDHRIVELTRALVRARPWSLSPDVQLEIARRWVNTASHIYGIEAPEVVRDVLPPYAFFGGYDRGVHRITLQEGRQLSIVTLLHEFRHALQVVRQENLGSEDDARAWSLSVFRKAAPRRFRRMVELGRILYTTPETEFAPRQVTVEIEYGTTDEETALTESAIEDGIRAMTEREMPDRIDRAATEGDRQHRDAEHQPHPEASEGEETATRRAFGLPS